MKIWLGWIIPSLFVAVWYGVAEFGMVSAVLLPSPARVAAALGDLFFSGIIITDFFWTLYRTAMGLAGGLVIGVLLGLLMGYYLVARQALGFLTDFIRSIPVAALIPLFMLMFGIGEAGKISLVIFFCSLIIMVNTIYGVRHASRMRIKVAKVLRLSESQIFHQVVFPEAVPHISAGIRLCVSLSLVMVIVMEMLVGAEFGVGVRIVESHLVYKIADMYAIIIFVGLVGYVLNKLYLLAEKRIHWAGK